MLFSSFHSFNCCIPKLEEMGYLLKEALKTLCGVKRWSYAVFWKLGCQNPRLLIWEECYYEPSTSVSPHGCHNCDSHLVTVPPEDLSCQPVTLAEDKLLSLINRMMSSNQICLVGEGIIGRAAFTGDYQWFLLNSYSKDFHPPEVSNEMRHQFSAGIQTVAVIPVSPHGVVQLGSSFSIMENLGFVNDIKSLILQLGCIPGALFSIGSSERAMVTGFPGRGLADTSEVGKMTSSNNLMVDSSKQLSNSSDCSRLISGQSNSLVRKIKENSLGTDSSVQSPYHPLEKAGFCPRSQVQNGDVRAEVICRNPNEQLNQFIASSSAYSGVNFQAAQDQMVARHYTEPIEKPISSALGAQNLVNDETRDLPSIVALKLRTRGSSVLDSSKSLDASQFLEGGVLLNEFKSQSGPIVPLPSFSAAPEPLLSSLTELGFQNNDLNELEGIPLFRLSEQLSAYTTEMLSGGFDQISYPVAMNHHQIGSACKTQTAGNDSTLAPNLQLTHLNEDKPLLESGCHGTVSLNLKYEDALQWSEGDDLFDILGMDMKNKIFSGKFDSAYSHKLSSASLISKDIQEADQCVNLVDEGLSEVDVFCMTGNDHLLDAVVSGARSASKQNSDDSSSCKSTLTRISSFSLPSYSLAYCPSNTTGKVHEDSFGILRPPPKEGTLGSGSRKGCTEKNEAACSQSNSLCSQIRLSADRGHAVKRDNSVLAAHSNGPDESIKPCRKKLKPGESSKPRPKDRQMIQDRLKELRDIVPNGGKCSIDALLERTVKHMLFLQGVVKHADKLKHVGESRISDREGRMLLKDNFEGGATWAFEIGSRPGSIIVEDLNPPRQLLVEMLCEDQGFFLEIADMVRRLGLTILTGTMESRNEKIWAQFAVEANRDVTRMEIFMSLVQALEQTMKAGSMPETAVGNHLIPHHSFTGATSIPVSRLPSSLQ